MAALTAPMEVPATISICTLCFTNALNTPQAKAPREPPPCMTRTFSIFLDSLCLVVPGLFYGITHRYDIIYKIAYLDKLFDI